MPPTLLPAYLLRQFHVRPDQPALGELIARRPLPRCPARIPASKQLARWEAAEVVLRLHARRQRAKRAVPSIVACKPNASRPPLEFLPVLSAMRLPNIPPALEFSQASGAHRANGRLPARHQRELHDGLTQK
jgi:hypothetical protein